MNLNLENSKKEKQTNNGPKDLKAQKWFQTKWGTFKHI